MKYYPKKTRKLPNDSKIKALYLDDDLTSYDIAKMYKITHNSVSKHLNRMGIIKPNIRTMNGKQGRYKEKNITKLGYPIFYNPKHPRSNSNGYVAKHILSIEEKTGRTPQRGEIIHHIDLDKMNYDIKNLYICKNESEHQKTHISLDKITSEIIKKGIIKFKDGKYE